MSAPPPLPTTPAPISFIVEVTAESGKALSANVKGIPDGPAGIDVDPAKLTDAYASVAKFLPTPTIAGGSSRGGKSRRNRKSRGGKSRKGRKSLRRK